MYYKIFLSNSFSWIQNEIFNELGGVIIKNDIYYETNLKSNHIIINCYDSINDDYKFILRFRIVDLIKKNKLYVHLHFSFEQTLIVEKIILLSNKTYKERIIDFYKIYNPSKNIDDIEMTLSKYETNIELLFVKLKKQYNCLLEIF